MDAAPKEVLVHTDGHHESLINNVHKGLVQGGHQVTPQSLNPHDKTPLEKAAAEVGSDLGYAVNTLLPGDGGIASGGLDRTVSGGKIAGLIRLRGGQKAV